LRQLGSIGSKPNTGATFGLISNHGSKFDQLFNDLYMNIGPFQPPKKVPPAWNEPAIEALSQVPGLELWHVREVTVWTDVSNEGAASMDRRGDSDE
jgi:hypothetical protein